MLIHKMSEPQAHFINIAHEIAISVLEQQVKEPCEYCNGKSLLHIKEDCTFKEFWGTYIEHPVEIDIKIRNGKILEAIPSDEQCIDACYDTLNVNYCPTCGRKLI